MQDVNAIFVTGNLVSWAFKCVDLEGLVFAGLHSDWSLGYLYSSFG